MDSLASLQGIIFINHRVMPVSNRTLSIVNSSPVLWRFAGAVGAETDG
jgi:hypothetical protein